MKTPILISAIALLSLFSCNEVSTSRNAELSDKIETTGKNTLKTLKTGDYSISSSDCLKILMKQILKHLMKY